MPAATAIIFLAAVHAATAYGDSIASNLINTPGGVGSVAPCWDGYPLAQQGKAGEAEMALKILQQMGAEHPRLPQLADRVRALRGC